MKANEQLPGVKTLEPVVKTTPQNAEHRLYAICRRLQERITDLEKRVSTLSTSFNRLERQNYRGADKAGPSFLKERVAASPEPGNGDGQADAGLLFG